MWIYLGVEVLEITDDAKHVLALAHILHKDPLECRLVLVELIKPTQRTCTSAKCAEKLPCMVNVQVPV